MEISKKKYQLEGVTVADIIKYKKEIIESALNNLKDI